MSKDQITLTNYEAAIAFTMLAVCSADIDRSQLTPAWETVLDKVMAGVEIEDLKDGRIAYTTRFRILSGDKT
jgi:hypothetical protein